MTIEERLAHLLEQHGIGCPRAVSLGGPAAVEAWCEQQELDIEAREEAEADAAAAEAPEEVRADMTGVILDRLDALESRVAEIDAVIADSPTEEAVGDVAAGGDPEPEGTKAPEPETTAEPEKKGKASKKGGKK